MVELITVSVRRQGLHPITDRVIETVQRAGLREGLCTLFIRHTSASLLIQENTDPTARQDLERWMNRLVPEQDPLYTHTIEGPDDMPGHIKAALTATSLSIPIWHAELALGSWQAIYLWEHRHAPGQRDIVLHIA